MPSILNIDVLTGPPGCGKTSKLMDEMLAQPGRYLFAMPRNDLIDERVRDLEERAEALHLRPTIVPIHSDQGLRAPVRRRVKDAASEHEDAGHVIVVVTHEALRSSDLGDYTGWHAVIDEPPDAVASNSLRIKVSWRLLAAIYELIPIPGTKWSKVAVRPDAPSIRGILDDDIADDLSAFHKQASSSQGVYVGLTDWSDASTRKSVQWWGAWTFLELSHFASVKVAGSGYFTSLLHLATEAWFPGQVEYHRHEVGAGRTAWPKVRIHYYTRGHRASTAFWSQNRGRDCLRKVGRHLSGVQTLGYWSGNEIVRERFDMSVHGLMVLPKQAGTNSLRHMTNCSMIYSSKVQQADDAILDVFGLSKEDIERARQTEDIEQFVYRGAIRCADFGGDYDIYLYDEWQAKALRLFLASHGITDVDLIGLDEVGIMDEERPKPGPKPLPLDEATLKQKAEERREKDKLRKRKERADKRQLKAEAGTLRKKGRPPKSAGSALHQRDVLGRAA